MPTRAALNDMAPDAFPIQGHAVRCFLERLADTDLVGAAQRVPDEGIVAVLLHGERRILVGQVFDRKTEYEIFVPRQGLLVVQVLRDEVVDLLVRRAEEAVVLHALDVACHVANVVLADVIVQRSIAAPLGYEVAIT